MGSLYIALILRPLLIFDICMDWGRVVFEVHVSRVILSVVLIPSCPGFREW